MNEALKDLAARLADEIAAHLAVTKPNLQIGTNTRGGMVMRMVAARANEFSDEELDAIEAEVERILEEKGVRN